MRLAFQSTRPRGRTRLRKWARFSTITGFNPRVLAGGRDFKNFTSVMLVVVSIHASSREDATLSSIACIAARVFQSTRPRGRTRQLANLPVSSSKVSIHASSREDATHLPPNPGYKNDVSIHASSREDATCACRPDLPAGLVSIHASSREDATCLWHGAPEPAPSFNPRVLAGGRDSIPRHFQHEIHVSIHASSREDATLLKNDQQDQEPFQSTRPRGRTRLIRRFYEYGE